MSTKNVKRILSIVGARPQFIKVAPLSDLLEKSGYQHQIIHTGQHFDDQMSSCFFSELGIKEPSENLNLGGGTHAEFTGSAMIALEKIYQEYMPDVVLVFGDTNTTLAGALAASKLLIPVLHIEAGLRSFDKAMPEEQNRVLTDHLSTFCACPSDKAMDNLKQENIQSLVVNTGDIMLDSVQLFLPQAAKLNVFDKLTSVPESVRSFFHVLTIHRASNTDSEIVLRSIFDHLATVNEPIIFPVHPRTKNCLQKYQISLPPNIYVIEPVGFLDMLHLLSKSQLIITDSGGLQKEAFYLSKPCIILRDTTEWVELLDIKASVLVFDGPNEFNGAQFDDAYQYFKKENFKLSDHSFPYGNGQSAQKIKAILDQYFLV